MPKKLLILFAFLSLVLTLSLYPKMARAEICPLTIKPSNSDQAANIERIGGFPYDFKDQVSITAFLKGKACFEQNKEYKIAIYPRTQANNPPIKQTKTSDNNDKSNVQLELNLKDKTDKGKKNTGSWGVKVCQGSDDKCLNSNSPVIAQGDFKVLTQPTELPKDLPFVNAENNKCVWRAAEIKPEDSVEERDTKEVRIKVENLTEGKKYGRWWAEERCWFGINCKIDEKIAKESTRIIAIPNDITKNFNGIRTLCIDVEGETRESVNCLRLVFTPQVLTDKDNRKCDPAGRGPATGCIPEQVNECAKNGLVCQAGQCIKATTSSGIACDPRGTGPDAGQPNPSLNGKDAPGISTAIGCIPTDFSTLVQQFVKVGVGAGGGVALLLIVAGAFQFITSAGNPDSLKAATGRITSALIGLLFVIFAVLLLQVIGGNILDIPGIPGFGVP